MERHRLTLAVAFAALIFISCNGSSLLSKRTAHEDYEHKLRSAGLLESELGNQWRQAAIGAIDNPIPITLPFREKSYFSAEKPSAEGYRLAVKRGMKIYIAHQLTADSGAKVFIDVWRMSGGSRKYIDGSDKVSDTILYTSRGDEEILLRIQPELLTSAGVDLSINYGPSLAFPVDSSGNPSFISYWGASRDGGKRNHEGVDIRAKFRTPALAATAGYARPADNRLGGKVVFLTDRENAVSLYYAHLDSQTVGNGMYVKPGDTIGLVGNTGNAKGTVPHLHFGIYANGGAINPIAFIEPNNQKPAEIKTATPESFRVISSRAVTLNSVMNSEKISIKPNTPLLIVAARDNEYRVNLPDGESVYIPADQTKSGPGQKKIAMRDIILTENPSPNGQPKMRIPKGESYTIIGYYQKYIMAEYENVTGWMEDIA